MPAPDQQAPAEGQRSQERGSTTGGAQAFRIQHCEWRERATHCAESPRQVQRPNPGNHMPDARDQFAADDRRPHAIPHRMARIFRLLPDPARANELGSLDPPENAFDLWRQWRNGHNRFTSFAASASRSSPHRSLPVHRWDSGACPDTRRFNTPYEIMCSTLLVSAESSCLCRLNSIEPPCTDPYARWCGRGGAERLLPIPIPDPSRKSSCYIRDARWH
jgi:hypothetical protein